MENSAHLLSNTRINPTDARDKDQSELYLWPPLLKRSAHFFVLSCSPELEYRRSLLIVRGEVGKNCTCRTLLDGK